LIPEVTLHPIRGAFELLGATFTPIPAEHGPVQVLGFRVGGMAYLTDFGRLPDSSKALLADLDDFIVDALRDEPHPMHQSVEQAVALVRELRPRRAWFTHIAHDLPHAATNARLAAMGLPNVQLSYDGLRFEVRI
jgi:phosphoribosyl 1,2-cyclic phosphate phosphodiesterase